MREESGYLVRATSTEGSSLSVLCITCNDGWCGQGGAVMLKWDKASPKIFLGWGGGDTWEFEPSSNKFFFYQRAVWIGIISSTISCEKAPFLIILTEKYEISKRRVLMLMMNLEIEKRLAESKIPVGSHSLACRRLLAFLPAVFSISNTSPNNPNCPSCWLIL